MTEGTFVAEASEFLTVCSSLTDTTESPIQQITVLNTSTATLNDEPDITLPKPTVSSTPRKKSSTPRKELFVPNTQSPVSIMPNSASKQNIYSCLNCEFHTKYQSSLTRHMEKHKPPTRCETCNSSFRSRRTLKGHELAHENGILCDQCSKFFNSPESLRKHKRAKHEGGHRYTCDICNRKFTEKGHYQGHVNRHMDVTPYVCAACGKEFGIKCNLQRHIKICEGQTNYACEQCTQVFKAKSYLKEHIEGCHAQEKIIHKCPCGKEFAQRGSLYRHKKQREH